MNLKDAIWLQWKLQLRDKSLLVPFFLLPFLFYLFIGNIFVHVMPEMKESLIASMSIFAITMGGLVALPLPILQFYRSTIKKTYQAGGLSLWMSAFGMVVSAIIHLLLVPLLIALSAPLLFDATPIQAPLVFFGQILCIIIATCMLGCALGFLVPSISKVTMVTQLLFLPSIMLSGIMFPSSMLNDFFLFLAKLFPATWGYQLLLSLGFASEFLLPLAALALLGALLSLFSLHHLKSS